MGRSKKKEKPIEYAHRWNPKEQRWERTIVGESKWDIDPERAEPKDWSDKTFAAAWIMAKENGDCITDLAAMFCTTHARIHNKKRSINRRYRKEMGLPEDSTHEVLPDIETFNKRWKDRIKTHWEEKPKKLSLAETLESLAGDRKNRLNLVSKKTKK